MLNDRELLDLMENPPQRRCWLLFQALRCLPLDRALSLAESAEGFFVTGSATEPHVSTCGAEANRASVDILAPKQVGADEVHRSNAKTRSAKTSISLSTEQREELLDRLAGGAANVELASAFGLSTRQVQGIRMGSAREIAKRRERRVGAAASPANTAELPASIEEAASPANTAELPASIEDIVRYLRQQDDVVVPQENGEFLVNGRFPMPLTDLAGRANRMRERQGKPKFDLPSGMSVLPRQTASANGHPLFWEQTAPHEPLS